MAQEIDARGLSCPAPVLRLKAAIEENHPAELCIMVDNEASVQNVSRFFESQGYAVSITPEGETFYVTGRVSGTAPAASQIPRVEIARKVMVLLSADRMGHGDDELGQKLMNNFVKTLKEMGRDLWRLVLINSGVKLTIHTAEVLPALQELNAAGVSILVCGTCLNHYRLLEEKAVGETTNMLDIITSMQVADSVISV